jgi:hypothetical protein
MPKSFKHKPALTQAERFVFSSVPAYRPLSFADG